jgi:hypothetical protein
MHGKVDVHLDNSVLSAPITISSYLFKVISEGIQTGADRMHMIALTRLVIKWLLSDNLKLNQRIFG